MKATRREVLVGLLGCVACGSTTDANKHPSDGSDGGAAGSSAGRDCMQPSASTDALYCLVSPLEVRVSGAMSLKSGQAVLVNVDDATAVILARDEQGFYARSAICTHACCVVALCGDSTCSTLTPSPDACATSAIVQPDAAGGILCPCHGSRFRLSDGAAITGPATKPLPAYAVRFEGPDAWIDTAQHVADTTRV